MAIHKRVKYNGGLLPGIILPWDPRLLQSENLFKYHVEVFSLQPMKQYYVITTTLFNDVLLNTLFLFCFFFLSGVSAW